MRRAILILLYKSLANYLDRDIFKNNHIKNPESIRLKSNARFLTRVHRYVQKIVYYLFIVLQVFDIAIMYTRSTGNYQ